jgi:signal transduction histidine kinase
MKPFARLWPDSLLMRTAVVLLAAVLLSNLVGLAVYSGERLDLLTSARGVELAEQIAVAARLLEESPPEERRRLVWSLKRPRMRLFWSFRPLTQQNANDWQSRLLRHAFLDELGEEAASRLRLAYGTRPGPGFGPRYGGGPGVLGTDDATEALARGGERRGRPGSGKTGVLVGSFALQDGSWLNFVAPLADLRPFWATPFFLVLVAGTTLAVAISLWAVQRAVRPLAMFAAAAEQLGRDVEAPPLAVEGPREVRQAAAAFNRMQERLRAFVHDRTQMLAAMSHDLRTPITRLRLRVELIDDPEQQTKMLTDLAEIQTMIDETLAFARDDAAREPAGPLDLAVLTQTICDAAADAGSAVQYEGPARGAAVIGRPGMLRRALTNLVNNAVVYGGNARVRLGVERDWSRIIIDDDGPGIPHDELERVFAPFYRLETSRSRETGGVGLGLAVVRTTIDAHGGRVTLANRPEGGLRVLVELPLAVAGMASQDGQANHV